MKIGNCHEKVGFDLEKRHRALPLIAVLLAQLNQVSAILRICPRCSAGTGWVPVIAVNPLDR